MPHLSKMIGTLLIFVSASSVSRTSHADALRGFIQKHQLLLQREDGTQTLVKAVGSTSSVQSDLDMLKNGDYVVARGTVDGSQATIDAIESLGLQALVGLWSSPKREVYEFQDFSRLNLYLPDATCSQVVKAGEFQYSVTPDQGTRYAIFVTGAESVTVGSLEFKKNRLVLNVIDPKTGLTSADIVLSPLASPRD